MMNQTLGDFFDFIINTRLQYLQSSEEDFENLHKLLSDDLEKEGDNNLWGKLFKKLNTKYGIIELEGITDKDIDIAKIHSEIHVLKNALINCLEEYTSDIKHFARISNALDDLFARILSLLTNEKFSRLTEKIDTLLYNEKLYKQAQAIAHIGNYDWDITKNKVVWTDELYRLYELEPQSCEITFDLILDLYHPHDREKLKIHTALSLQDKNPRELFHRTILKDGSIRYLHAKNEVIRDENGQPLHLVGTTQDVTSQKVLETQLIESRNFIQHIADATPAIIISYRLESNKLLFLNEGLMKILGYDANEVYRKGMAFFDGIVHPDDLNRYSNFRATLFNVTAEDLQKNTYNLPSIEFRLCHADGAYRWLQCIETLFHGNNDTTDVLQVMLDVTERVQSEIILQERTIALQQSNTRLEEFAFIASHDLNEPLRKITVFSDRILTGNNLQEEDRYYLNKIIKSSKRMQQMISDILSLSVLSDTQVPELCNLKVLVEEVIQDFDIRIEESKAVITYTDLPEIKVLPSQIRQLFQNLINNSLKFSRNTVSPRIKIEHSYIKGIDLKHLKQMPSVSQAYLHLRISDNGIGFSNAFAEKIFVIFQRLHSKDAYEGTGIGLPICKKIVENHGGVIYAEGEPGKGATFNIILPM